MLIKLNDNSSALLEIRHYTDLVTLSLSHSFGADGELVYKHHALFITGQPLRSHFFYDDEKLALRDYRKIYKYLQKIHEKGKKK